jgi:hypothetical protein
MAGRLARRYTEAGARRIGQPFLSTRETAMRTRIATAAVVLVIGTAAWALAQREERPRPRGVPAVVDQPAPQPALPPDLAEAEAVPAAPSVPPPMGPQPLPTPTRAYPAPDATASSFLAMAKAEIERLTAEKRAAEKELARVRARIQAAEAGIAKWRSLAKWSIS